ncbi:MAG: hypothetical protein IJ794_01225 [Lachnospiraceae bacterium]|nr:hypothetical protein [Lachnospiraceae bacterium]
MPFIKAKVNVPLSEEQETELKTRMGQIIELVPGKSEEYLLLEFEDNCRLWLRGRNEEPIVYIEAAIFRLPVKGATPFSVKTNYNSGAISLSKSCCSRRN